MKAMIVLGGVLLGALGLVAALSSDKSKARPGYVLHEWGTFTTVSGSDGVLLTGLEREEEHLPPFVHSHFGMENTTQNQSFRGGLLRPVVNPGEEPIPVLVANQALMFKGFWRRELRNVAVKMETPVVYFHTEEKLSVDLRVDFKGGAISQWFPQRAEGETPPAVTNLLPGAAKEGEKPPSAAEQDKAKGVIDFRKGYDGWIGWKVDVLPRDQVDPVKLFRREETPSWMYPKVRKAAVVRNAQGEHEDYLFYRGVGNFAQPVRTTVDAEERLSIHNESSERVPFAFVFERANGVTRFAVLKEGV
ncbi:MAG: hypothetical protein O3A92_01160 [Verrucomicrobia bacterium]|nr:hypothetical protein [Verrucomicrobiota bacterium]